MTITARHLEGLGNDAGVISSYEYQQAQRVEMVRISDVDTGDILVIDGDDYQLTGMYIIPEGWVIEAVSKAGTLYIDLVVSEAGAMPWVERATTG